MSKKELSRVDILTRVINGKIVQKKAAEELGISIRQVKRLCKRVKADGVIGLRHGNRGKLSKRKISSNTYAEVLELIKSDYIEFGPQLIKEQLEIRNQINVSREWIRGTMIKEGLWKVKQRKRNCYYQRRNRREREGELLQIDGSPEYWFEDRGPKCCLINMVDDATGKIASCMFVEAECLEGYFKSIKRCIIEYGRPIAIYSDRHTIFKSQKEENAAPTQFGRALEELGIELIYANSPQAKGRVERSHGTLQDRLIKMMRLEGISSIEAGNQYLEEFRKDYNKRFGKAAQSNSIAYRELLKDQNLDRILCRKEERKVSKNLEVHYKHTIYQIIADMNIRKLIGATVLVSELDNGVRIEFQGQPLEYKIYGSQPYQERVFDRKRIDSFLDRKTALTAIQRDRKKKVVNF